MKRVVSIILMLTLFLSCIPSNVVATEKSGATGQTASLRVETAYADIGEQVEVNVWISDNPGIAGATLSVSYHQHLTLIGAESGEVFSSLDFSGNEVTSFLNPCKFSWDSESGEAEGDGIILTLTFAVSEQAVCNSNLDIAVSYREGDIYGEEEDIALTITNGYVTVIDYMPGDLFEDRVINTKDVRLIRQLINGNCTMEVNEAAADVNADGVINTKDTRLIRRFINGYPGTILLPSPAKCSHTMEHTPYKAPTCTEEGNVAYWYCSTCKKYFNDEVGTTELTEAQLVRPAVGHTPVTDPAVEPTYDSVGWTEGSHCSACGTTLVEQVEIPMLKKRTVLVTYHYEGLEQDSYLTDYVRENNVAAFNSNDTEYNTTEKSYTLKALGNNAVPGYKFLGWVDGYGDPVTTIAKGDEGHIDIYANWQIITYWVTFDSPDVPAANIPAYDYSNTNIPAESVHYTVATGLTLDNHNPSLFNYKFIGWSDDNGFLINRIMPGTTGDITLHANWTADRNRATSYQSYGEPIIIEDDINGQLLFVYNIGRIDNVPLNEGYYLGKFEVLDQTVEYTISDYITTEDTTRINEMISNATTESSGWTLSKDWNQLYGSSEETGSMSEKSDERTNSQGTVVGGEYFVSNSNGGSSYVSNESGGSWSNSAKVTTEDSVGINKSYDLNSMAYCDAQLGFKNEIEVSAGVSVPVSIAKVSAGVKNTTTVEAGVQNGRKDEVALHGDSSESHYVGTVQTSDQSAYFNSTQSASSNWNSTSGYNRSQSLHETEEVTTALKEQILKNTTHNVQKSLGGTSGETHNKETSAMKANEYGTSVTISQGSDTTETKTTHFYGSGSGHYRVVPMGIIHVYGVVGYDIATGSFYTYCFNVQDDKVEEQLDYSKDRMSFDDCENGVVTFKVPYEVHEYVAGFVGKTDGLEISYDGVVTGFEPTENYDGTIVVPMYEAKDNLDSTTHSSVKVTSFTADAFAEVKDSVKTIVLPVYITEIPDNAFAGFTQLQTVIAYGVTKIGANAFKGCTSLETFYVDTAITSLGENAFDDVGEIFVAAHDSKVADAAIKSGAKRITLNIAYIEDTFENKKVEIGKDTAYFGIIGNGGVYNNVEIHSDAGETMINNMIFANNTDTPLRISSEKVLLARVTVDNSPSFAMILTGDNVSVALLGDVLLNSSSGNAVLSKNVTLSKAAQNTTSAMKVNGAYLVCGDVVNKETFLNVTPTVISQTEYEKYLTSCVVTFDPNGGEVSVKEKLAYYKQPYGELPTPTRPGYEFAGWYTAKTGGTKITADTIVTVLVNQTLYARWNAMAYHVNWNTGTGYTIAVNRTSSPYAKAATGALSSGDVVYYGDVLKVTYTKADYYTIKTHGETAITVTADVTPDQIYATAELNPLSDWVKAENLPADAEVVNRKWTYTMTSYTTSSSSTLSGWTHYDTTSEWSAYGSWSSWSTSPAYDSDSRDAESKSEHTGYNMITYNTMSTGGSRQFRSFSIDGKYSSYGCSSSYGEYCYSRHASISEVNAATTVAPGKYTSACTYPGYNKDSKTGYVLSYGDTSCVFFISSNTYTTYYRYRDRSLVYTYYFYKTEELLPSDSYPTGENISEIQEWVQYREK